MAQALASWQDWPKMSWTWAEIAAATGAALPAAAAGRIESVSTDSRRLPPGALFVALRGPHHDGHDHAAAALRHGAAAVLVERVPTGVDPTRALLVSDTLRALGDLAASTRRRQPLRVAAITGSNGKTTTKEMVAAICAQASFVPPRRAVLKTHGNENNLVGLPLTLLRLTGDEAVAVLEMGMNAPGEIARLAEIAAPDVGVITNIGPAHLEGLGDIAGVAAAKGELFAGMSSDAVAAVNMEDAWVVRVAEAFPGRRVEFGAGREVAAHAVRDTGFDGLGFDLAVAGRTAPVRLPLSGAHNVSNALAAAAVAHGLGIDLAAIAAGLEAVTPPPMRMQVVKLPNGVTVVNDGYNANPASMEAALRALARQPGRSIAVLGEMRELGAQTESLHRDLGRLTARLGIQILVAVGPGADPIVDGARAVAPGMEIHRCSDGEAAAAVLTALWRPGDAILVKASRGPDNDPAVRRYGARMAEVAALLEEAGGRS